MTIDLDNPPPEARTYVDLYERTKRELDASLRNNERLVASRDMWQRNYDETCRRHVAHIGELAADRDALRFSGVVAPEHQERHA